MTDDELDELLAERIADLASRVRLPHGALAKELAVLLPGGWSQEIVARAAVAEMEADDLAAAIVHLCQMLAEAVASAEYANRRADRIERKLKKLEEA